MNAQLTVRKFKSKGVEVLSVTNSLGHTKFCVETEIVTVSQNEYGVTKTKAKHVSFINLDADTAAKVTLGADMNQILVAEGFEPMHPYVQLSFEPFYEGQENAKKKVNGELVDSLRDGRIFYRQNVLSKDSTLKNVWGHINDEGKFVAGEATTAPRVSAEDTLA